MREQTWKRGRVSRGLGAAALLAGLLLGLAHPAWAGEDWQPITPEELALKDDPLRPGAAAIILYRETFSDHNKDIHTHFFRIKILTQDGRKYTNLELPFVKQIFEIKEVEARTVRPDGKVVPFAGQAFERTVVKGRGVKLLAKTLTLPEVEVGSIIDYRYQVKWRTGWAQWWIIQEELTLLRGRFTVQPFESSFATLHWLTYWLPGKQLEFHGRDYLLAVENVPAFQHEDFSPPDDFLKMRVRFFYVSALAALPEVFWRERGQELYKENEKFISRNRQVEREVARLVSPTDAPETKLRKLYARAQQVRNLNYERRKTEQEAKRAGIAENKSADNALARGFGTGYDINRLLVALARAAGFKADITWLTTLQVGHFYRDVLDTTQLNAHVVLVRLEGKDLFLDPATRFAPYGYLTPDQTNVRGIRLMKDGVEFVQTPAAKSTDALSRRTGTLHLAEDGHLEGVVQVTFHGQAALSRRLGAREDDEATRRKNIEEEVKGWFPAGGSVEVETSGPWEASEEPLVWQLKVNVANFATATGRRLLVPVGVFQTQRQHPFEHAERVHQVYFSYPWEEKDELTLAFPTGFEIEGVPAMMRVTPAFASYEIEPRHDGPALRISRRFAMHWQVFSIEIYPGLRDFYNKVRAGDEQHVVLRAAEAAK